MPDACFYAEKSKMWESIVKYGNGEKSCLQWARLQYTIPMSIKEEHNYGNYCNNKERLSRESC